MLAPAARASRCAAAARARAIRRGALTAAVSRPSSSLRPVSSATTSHFTRRLAFTELDLRHDPAAGVLTVRLDREHRLNALSEHMGNELLRLCSALRAEGPGSDVRCVVITGAGRAFSTGRDLKESIAHTPEDGRRYLELCFDSAGALASVPMPTIAAINGPCFGWGLEAALGCDIRLAADSATLCFPETRIGIFPGAGGVARLCKLVPLAQAKQMVFSARTLTGVEAAAAGIVNSSFATRETLLEEALALASDVAANAPLAVRDAKVLFDTVADAPLAEALQRSRAPRLALNATRDFAEGLAAFADKRRPQFHGE